MGLVLTTGTGLMGDLGVIPTGIRVSRIVPMGAKIECT